MPRLSVILPIYNVEEYIEECFQSLVKQIDGDVEVICVDDGSTDNSGKICDQYAEKYAYFHILHSSNKGVGAARNLGLSIAKGDYIACCDPDDYLAENWYIGIKHILSKKPDIGIFDYVVFDTNKRELINYMPKEGFLEKKQFLLDIVEDIKIQSQLWQKVFKRELLEKVRFPENVKCMEDYAILHKLILQAEKIYYLPDALYNYRKRNNGLVMAIDIGKSFDCYKIATKRYCDLQKAHYDVSSIGFLMQAMGVCIQFAKSGKSNRSLFVNENKECANVIRKNLFRIMKSNIPIREKIKFGVIALGLHCNVMTIYNFMKGRC